MGVIRDKPGVKYTIIAPGGHHILAVLDNLAHALPFDITITSACDGEHSGPNDPHHEGNAYDVRSHDLPDKEAFLMRLKGALGEANFYAFLEDEDTGNEHIHVQVKKGTTYPPEL